MKTILFVVDILWGLAYHAFTAVDDALDAWGEDD